MEKYKLPIWNYYGNAFIVNVNSKYYMCLEDYDNDFNDLTEQEFNNSDEDLMIKKVEISEQVYNELKTKIKSA